MLRCSLLLGLLLAAASAEMGLPPFVLLSPTTFKASHSADMKLLLFTETTGNISVEYVSNVYRYTYNPYKQHTTSTLLDEKTLMITSSDKVVSVSVQVPSIIEGSHILKWRISLDGFGDFEDSVFLEQQISKSNSGYKSYVQTDKSVYKPGQPVRFRGFQIGSDLKGIEVRGMNASVKNPSGIEVFRETLDSKDGIVHQGSFLLADEVQTGEYTITLEGHVSAVCTFTVDEYVLPQFGIKIEAPKYIPSDGQTVSGSVEATYTYGKPLTGSIWLTFSVSNNALTGSYLLKETKMELEEGKANWEVDLDMVMTKTRYLFNPWCTPSSLKVTARVGEDEEPVEEIIKFSQTAVDLSFNKNTQRHYSAGFPFYVELDVKALSQRSEVEGSTVRLTMISGLKTLTRENKDVLVQDGKVFATFEVPKDACAVKITAELETEDSCEAVFACYQPERMVAHNDQFVRFSKEEPATYNIGDTATFTLLASKRQEILFMVIMSKGVIVDSWSITPDWMVLPDGKFKTEGSFTIPSTLNVRSRLLVLSAHENNGHIMADGMDLCMEEFLPHSVTFTLNKMTAQPGDNITATLTSDPVSFVGISMSDKALELMRAPCKLMTRDGTLSFLRGLDSGTEKDLTCERDDPYQCTSNTEVKIIDVKDLLSNEGIDIDTNMNLFDYVAPRKADTDNYGGGRNYKLPYSYSSAAAAYITASFTPEPASEIALDSDDPDNASAENEKPARLRNYFPESWLWTDVTTDESGNSVLTVTAPDTITGWKGNAFGLSPENGLGFSEDVEFTTFLNFFIKISLPYSGVVGERIVIPVKVFNYRDESVTSDVRISSKLWDTVRESVTVEANSFATLNYTVSLTEAGHHSITVRASSSAGDGDAIERNLLVKPGGIRNVEVKNLLIVEESYNSDKEVLNVALPDTFIPGSHELKILAFGDIMGNAATGISSLIQLPSGCGEQNMHKIAVNVFAANYLRSVYDDGLPEYLQINIQHNLNIGMQQQLNYRKSGGMYSVFSGGEASSWLSAFVYRIFAQFPEDVHVPCDRVVDEDRRMLFEFMSYDSDSRSLTLDPMEGWAPAQYYNEKSWWSYLLTSVLERYYGNDRCKNSNSHWREAEMLTALCGNLKERQMKDDDCCNAHIALYALALCEEHGFIERGETKEIRDTCIVPTSDSSAMYAKCGPLDSGRRVEATSYAALNYMKRERNLNKATSLIMWLASQRSESGGFRSSQDTVVALQALSTFARLTSSTETSTDLNILIGKGRSYFEKISIEEDDKSVKEVFLRPNVGNYKIKWTGTGTAFVQLISTYHQSELDDQSNLFQLNVNMVEEGDMGIVTLDFTIDEVKAASMVLIEMTALTGYAFKKPQLESYLMQTGQIVSRYDIKEGGQRLQLYIDPSVTAGRYELMIPVIEDFTVMNRVSAQVSILDYYNPAARQVAFYSSMGSGSIEGSESCSTFHSCDVFERADVIVSGIISSLKDDSFQMIGGMKIRDCGDHIQDMSRLTFSLTSRQDQLCSQPYQDAVAVVLAVVSDEGGLTVIGVVDYKILVSSTDSCETEYNSCYADI